MFLTLNFDVYYFTHYIYLYAVVFPLGNCFVLHPCGHSTICFRLHKWLQYLLFNNCDRVFTSMKTTIKSLILFSSSLYFNWLWHSETKDKWCVFVNLWRLLILESSNIGNNRRNLMCRVSGVWYPKKDKNCFLLFYFEKSFSSQIIQNIFYTLLYCPPLSNRIRQAFYSKGF